MTPTHDIDVAFSHNPCICVIYFLLTHTTQEEEILSRIEAAADNPLALEEAGYAIFDLYPERRGNLFSDEVSAHLLILPASC